MAILSRSEEDMAYNHESNIFIQIMVMIENSKAPVIILNRRST